MLNISREELSNLLIRAFEEGFCGYRDLRDDLIEVLLKEVEDRQQKVENISSNKKNRIPMGTGPILTATSNHVIEMIDNYVEEENIDPPLHGRSSAGIGAIPRQPVQIESLVDINNIPINIEYSIPPPTIPPLNYYTNRPQQIQANGFSSFEASVEMLNILQSYQTN